MASSSSSSTSSIGSSQSSLAVSSPPIPEAYRLSNDQIQKNNQALQIANQKFNLFVLAGIGAGMAFTWAKIEPESLLGGLAALISGFVIGPFLGAACSACIGNKPPTQVRLAGNSPLQTLPNDLYHYLDDFLTLRESARMPSSRTLRRLTDYSRARTSILHLVGMSSLIGEKLQTVLSRYPCITNLAVINDNPSPSKEVFGPILQLKPLKVLLITIPDLSPNVGDDKNGMWQKFLEKLDLSRMEILECPYVKDPEVGSFWTQLGPKLAASSLKFFNCMDRTENSSPANAKMLLQSLPKTIERLNLYSVTLTDELIDMILEKFNLEAMSRCALHFSPQANGEKAQKLLERLPFAEMTHIGLKDQEGSTCLTSALIQQIGVKLTKNKQLKHLTILSKSPDVTMDSFIPLIPALRSPLLSHLSLVSQGSREDRRKLDFIQHLTIQQSVLWDSNFTMHLSDGYILLDHSQ